MLAKRTLSMAVVVAVCSLLSFMPFATEGRAQSCVEATCGTGTLRGDVDGSGLVDALDLGLLIEYCFTPDHPGLPVPLCNAEVNGWCNYWYDCEPTIGDLNRLIRHLFGGVPLSDDCWHPTTQDIPRGDLIATGMCDCPPGNHTVTLWLQLENLDQNDPKRIYAYSAPIRVISFMHDVTINSVTVESEYTNGGQWINHGSLIRDEDEVFAWAVGGSIPSDVISFGDPPLNLVELSVNCSNQSAQIRQIHALASHWPPSFVPVYAAAGQIEGNGGRQEEIVEEELVFVVKKESVPTTSETGLGILIVLLVMTGIVVVSRMWRLRTQS